MQALLKRASVGGSYNVDVSLTQFNNWYLRSVGLHSPETQEALRYAYPDFQPRHDTDIFELITMTIGATMAANGNGEGQLFDAARLTSGPIRWGKEDEVAKYLDWRRIVMVSVDGKNDQVVFDFQNGSCMPGSDEPIWL